MYVIINGVSSDTIQGLQVLSLPPITKPKMRRQVDTIDGRDGDIITELGYEAYDRTITVLLHHNYDLDAITAFFNTSGEIIFSNEPDKKYYFQLLEKIDYERAVQFKTANITFHVQPYKYPVNETPLTVSTTAWEGTDYDQTPYIFRATKDSSVEAGNREVIEQITGGTVAWNQLIKNEWITSSTTAYGLTITNNGDGTVTINGTVTGKGSLGTSIYAYINSSIGTSFFHCIKDHKYLYLAPKLPDGVSGYNVLSGSTPAMGYKQRNGSAIYNCLQTADTYAFGRLEQIQNGATFNNYKYYFRLIDLTQMFGTAIADYIYNLEQSTAGAGVSLFKSLFPKDYYPYNAGELMSVKTSARETVGKNLFAPYTRSDSSANGVTWSYQGDSFTARGTATGASYASLIGNNWQPVEESIFGNLLGKQITISGGKDGIYMNLAFRRNSSDSGYQTNWVTNGTITVPTDGSYQVYFNARVTSGWSGEATIRPQVELGSTATSYEPYQKHTYPLSNIELRGIPKLVNNKLTYDGDIYKADGSVTIKYGIVDLGTLTWNAIVDGGFYAGLPDIIKNCKNAIASTLLFVSSANDTTGGAMFGRLSDKQFAFYQNLSRIFVKDTAYTTAESFKTAMNGVYLVYELATPTTETTTPYTETQICDADGTEEFIDSRDVQIPVGHKTRYMQINDPAEIIVPNAGNVPSAPTIQLTGSGTVGVYLGNAQTLQVNIPEDGITIDTEAQDATSNGQLANRSVTGDYDSVRLQPGDNDVSFSGDVSAVITNYTRWV